MSRRSAIVIVSLAAVVPRLLVVALERQQLIGSLPEKSDRFARTLVDSGTFGFIAGVPSAYTQPLYALFLAPLYATFDTRWIAVGLAQVVVATGTALLVYAIGSRVATRGIGVVAAVISTLHPYLVWHDVHLNREVLDGFLAALLTLIVVIATERASLRIVAAAGLTVGLAILGNARLTLLPLALAGYLFWTIAPRRRGALAAATLVAVAAAVVAPWIVRNHVSVGCATITTDARALWKANNPATFGILRNGGWIDQVPELPGAPPWPELAADLTAGGTPTTVDECAQMRFYRGEVLDFWRTQPGEKAKLSAQAVWMLWRPAVTVEGGESLGTASRLSRNVFEPVYVLALYALALAGLARLPRRYLALTLLLLAYGTLMAAVFAGTVRYRAPWDFLLCVPAAITLSRVAATIGGRAGREATS
jgi:4-amino-4-deoxy-L-arabinose transferase-like glycosyltransferase